MPHVSRSEVFIVDDEPTSCELLSAIFTVEGYRVTSFEEGNSFLAVAHKRAPALILLDVNLPGRSGLDVLKELDAPNYPAPVFMISGQTDIPTVSAPSSKERWISSRNRLRLTRSLPKSEK